MQRFNPDQQREMINSRHRFEAYRAASERRLAARGSLVWSRTKGIEYLLRSGYETGRRRQRSLGRRSPETERIKAEFERARSATKERWDAVSEALSRQAAINRAVGLGRVPLLAARIVRALDASGRLGRGVKIVGTHAIYAYEAMAGAFVDPEVTTTEDLDLLLDARRRFRAVASDDVDDSTWVSLLRSVDRSFERATAPFGAVNSDGYIVDLIKPLRNPPWRPDRPGKAPRADDLSAVEIEGLVWLENAPSFEAVAIDARGEPLRLATVDPRAFAAHKLWLSGRRSRDPLQRRRDRAQAEVVAALCGRDFLDMPYVASELRALPVEVVDKARSLFQRA